MIRMGVCVEHSIEMADVFADGLLAKIRRGVNEYGVPAVLNQYRRAGAAVTRVAGAANGALASDCRNAHRRTTAQHGERRLHFAAGTCCGPLAMALVTSTYAMRSS